MGSKSNFVVKILHLLLILPLISFSQSFKGQILDVNGNPISNATVQIKKLNEENTLLFTSTNAEGKFEIQKNINQQNAQLKISFIGYTTFKENFKVDSDLNEFGTIILKENIEELKEVIVKAESSGISQKGDITTFKIERFFNGTEENLKDVIQRIPGLNINDKGKITANGKTIDNLLIDGEDLYKNQHQIATENLSSKLINSIELIQNYIGFENVNKEEKSGKTALNIKIKEEFKNKFTGALDLGGGFEKQYKIKNSVLNFNKKFQFSAITNFNNIAENPISIDDYYDLVEEKSQEKESKVIFSNLNDIPSFLNSKDRVSDKTNIFNSINLIYNINKKTKLDFYSIINDSKQSLNIYKEQKFYNEDDDLTIIEDNKNIEKNTFGSFNAKLIYKQNDTTIHIFKSNFLFDFSKNFNNINNFTNTIPKEISQNNYLQKYSFAASYNLSKKINNKFFEFKSFFVNSNNNGDLKINSNDLYLNSSYLNSDNSLNQYSNKTRNEFVNSGSLQIKKKKFTFLLVNNINLNNNKLYSILNNSNDINDLQLNYFTNNTSINTKYQLNGVVTISIEPDFTFNKINFNNNSYFSSYFGYTTSVKAVFNTTNVLQISNSLSNNHSNIDNLLTSEVVKDYRTIANNYDVKSTTILPSIQYNLNYFSFDIKNKFSFIFNASHKINLRSIENNIIATEEVTYLSNAIISGEKSNFIFAFLEKQPKNIPIGFSISASYTNTSKTISNNAINVDFKNNLFSGMFETKSRYKEFPIHFNTGLKISNDNYVYNNSKSNLKVHQLYCKLNGKIYENIYWNLNSEYFSYKNADIATNYLNVSPILRFSPEKSKFEYSIIGNNILNLNSKSILENYSNSNYSEFLRKPILSGYVLLNLKYKF